MRERLCVAGLLALMGLGGATGCEAVWGRLSVPAPENCVVSPSACAQGQVCNPVSQLCEAAVVLSQVSPSRAKTGESIPVTITGTNFQPGMVVRWNGVALSPVTVDSTTQLRVTAPLSTDGGWRVTIEVSSPGGLSASRSDLFSYYSTAVTFQIVTPSVQAFNGLFSMRVIPAGPMQRASIGFADSGHVRAVTVSDDGKTTTDLFTAAAPSTVTGLLPGDLNGDGVRDLLLASDAGFYWMTGNPDFSFQQYRPLQAGTRAASDLGLGDLDNDGHADVVGIDAMNNRLAILGNAGTQPSMFSPGSGTLRSLALGQLDGQPGDDVAVLYSGTADHFSVIHGGAALASYPDVSIASCQSGDLKIGRFGSGLTQALLLTCQDRVQLLQGTGGGAFSAGASWPVDSLTQKVVGEPLLADFDGDGDLDVVVVRGPLTGTLPAELWLLDNSDGNGSLLARQLAGNVTVGAGVFLDAGDVNNDGKPDVIIADRNPSATAPLTVLFNRSN